MAANKKNNFQISTGIFCIQHRLALNFFVIMFFLQLAAMLAAILIISSWKLLKFTGYRGLQNTYFHQIFLWSCLDGMVYLMWYFIFEMAAILEAILKICTWPFACLVSLYESGFWCSLLHTISHWQDKDFSTFHFSKWRPIWPQFTKWPPIKKIFFRFWRDFLHAISV